MSLSTRMTRRPHPLDAARGREVADRVDADADMRALLAGAAGSSPYLARSIQAEADWLPGAMADPEGAMSDLLATLAPDRPALRRAKRRAALLIALADLSGAWSLEEVTGALTRLADRATDLTLSTHVDEQVARGRLIAPTGLFALAMGKMGAGELNYSSDIDLILLFEPQPGGQAPAEARAALIRAARAAMQDLSSVTPDGYVFRTDLRLRPDPSATPIVVSTDFARAYYESVGRGWERAAHIKARPCAGDLDAGARHLATLRPFVWRRHLDFAAIEEAHDMRRAIQDHKRTEARAGLAGRDLKLSRGGIRDIEFFAQTKQVIAGGRDPSLRARGTVPALATLAEAGWLAKADAADLTAAYRGHREIEHRLQMIADAQTHALPEEDAGFDRLAALCGTDAASLRRDVARRLEVVRDITEPFFAPSRAAPAPAPVEARWTTYPALRSPRAAAIFERIRPALTARLDAAHDPAAAHAAFDAFLSALPAGVQIFSLFEANPQLGDLIADICSAAAPLAQHLGRNPQILDAVLSGDFFAPWPGPGPLRSELRRAMDAEADWEAALDAARRWAAETRFRVGIHHLRGLMDWRAAGAAYADVARAVLCVLAPRVAGRLAPRHGPAPGRGACVVAMGSTGAGRLTATSDLDLLVIYDEAGQAMSDGPRPLASRVWFARFTQGLITALSAPMSQGRLYEVDMRLRPSGRQGPVAVSLTAFAAYQMDDAWVWEHLALTRALPLTGVRSLRRDVERTRRAVLRARGDPSVVLPATREMRDRLAAAQPPADPLDPRRGAGRGMEVDLTAQAATLIAGAPDRDPDAQLAHLSRLIPDPGPLRAMAEASGRLRLARALAEGDAAARLAGGADAEGLASRLAEMSLRAREAVDRALTPPPRSAKRSPDQPEGPT
ncbi:MAG: glutamine-synthetase adenylyltransferase [Paracoccaceae bacterium]